MTTKNISTITQERLKELLDYDPETGVFVWKVRIGNRDSIGHVAGGIGGKGYPCIGIYGGQYRSHRLAFLWMTGELPTNEIDHINRERTDNRWKNLRAVTHKGNSRNMPMKSVNTSGITGVSWFKRDSTWRARIKVDYESIHLGLFDSLLDAAAARKSAEHRYGFHANHGIQIAKQQGSV